MGGQLEQKKTFEERLMSRIKESIGELVTEEDLKKIVERGIQQSLFEKRFEKGFRDYDRPIEKVPFAQEVAQTLLKKEMRRAVAKWIKDNPDELRKLLDGVIRDGITGVMLSSFREMTTGPLAGFHHEVVKRLTNLEQFTNAPPPPSY